MYPDYEGATGEPSYEDPKKVTWSPRGRLRGLGSGSDLGIRSFRGLEPRLE